MAQTSWQRRFPFLEQDLGQLSAALPGRFSGQRVARASPLQGGLRNTNYQIWLEGQAEPRVLRLYVADAGWQVAAVLDWEFALAGPPLVDFGIYLRDLDELPASYASELAAGYREAGGELPDGWAELGRLYDVLSLCSMLETARDAASLREMRRLLANTIASLG